MVNSKSKRSDNLHWQTENKILLLEFKCTSIESNSIDLVYIVSYIYMIIINIFFSFKHTKNLLSCINNTSIVVQSLYKHCIKPQNISWIIVLIKVITITVLFYVTAYYTYVLYINCNIFLFIVTKCYIFHVIT